MGDVVRVKVPWMQIGWFVPLRGNICARLDTGFDDRARVRAVIWIHIQNHIAAGLCEDRSNICDSFLAVSLSDESDIFGANRFSERLTTLVPGGVIRI
jgi:hypothetical protein